LKNDKASGDDFIVKEYIKSSIDLILPVYIKMFNCIFSSGIVLNSAKKNSRFARQQTKYSNYCVVRKKISERNKKP
jgi:hypothetical protein